VLASGGLVLVLTNAKAGTLDPVGAVLALAAAMVYTTYILTSQGIAGRISPTVLSALVCTGATVTLTAGTALIGDLQPGAVTAAGWGWLLSLAVVSTVVAVSLFFAGLRRVGPTSAAILSTAEPVVTVILAFLVFGEVLGPLQLLGGAFVIVAVLVLASGRPADATDAVHRKRTRWMSMTPRRAVSTVQPRSRAASTKPAAVGRDGSASQATGARRGSSESIRATVGRS